MRRTLYLVVLAILGLLPCSTAAGAVVTPLHYVALGDSYSSGEGNGPFDGNCHRALAADSAYPRILPSLVNYLGAPEFHACTGAMSADVVSRAQPKRGAQKRQVDYLSPNSRLVTLTIGGNDLGFSSIIATCLLPTDCTHSKLAERVSEGLTTIQAKLTQVYERVRESMDPHGYLVFSGYPHLFIAGPAAGCKHFISAQEAAWIDSLVDAGNVRIAAAVRAARRADANVAYVNVVDDFAGHELCSLNPWLYGIKFSLHEGINLVQGSYHPTVQGQRAYAVAIAASLRTHRLR
jgi:lysophospholipase L1-like esterase